MREEVQNESTENLQCTLADCEAFTCEVSEEHVWQVR
jgi:hypothetical protein